jgi:peroxiredoxin Q/BCP
MIESGQKAPDFTLPAHDGTSVTLSALRGKNVVLYFYPKDDTPGCTTEACHFRDHLGQLTSHGAVVLGVSADSLERHQKFADKYDLNFQLLSDTDHKVLEAYGAWQLKKNYGKEYWGIVRSTFLIDKEGVVRKAWPRVTVQRKNKDGEVTKRHVDAVLTELEKLG